MMDGSLAMPYTVLFRCTANSARSIMAEALLNSLGAGRFQAFSAGAGPSGMVHPLALDALHRAGCDTRGLRSKSWNEFIGERAPRIDFVITLCDRAAAQACPVFPGQPVTAHWGVPDPAVNSGSGALQREAFSVALSTLRRRVQHLTSLPFDSVDMIALRSAVREIGAI
jgi:protein-tyrosine-phosphatase